MDDSHGVDSTELEKFRKLRRIGVFAQIAFGLLLLVVCMAVFVLQPRQSVRLFYTVYLPVTLLYCVTSLAWSMNLKMKWAKIVKAGESGGFPRHPVRCEIYGIVNPHYTGDVYVLPQTAPPTMPQRLAPDFPPPYNSVVSADNTHESKCSTSR